MSAPAMKVRPAPITTTACHVRVGVRVVDAGHQGFRNAGAERVDRRILDVEDADAAMRLGANERCSHFRKTILQCPRVPIE